MEIKFEKVTLYRNYRTPLEKRILNNFSLTIPEKKVTAILGDADKSIIGKLICALELPNIGKIKIGKHIIENRRYIKNINSLRFQIGYVFSNPNDFLFHKTVKEEIEYGMKHYNYRTDKIDVRPIDALKMVGLDEKYYKRNPLEMSLTEQKKVMLASIIAYNPDVIIFDEFEKGLNHQDRENIVRLIKLLKTKYNRTIIVISNDTNFLLNFVDYYYVIKKGEVVFSCTKEELYNKEIDKHFEIPNIISFVLKAREKGSNMVNQYEINELIKEVYRDVK